jgi:hypothetical protein
MDTIETPSTTEPTDHKPNENSPIVDGKNGKLKLV